MPGSFPLWFHLLVRFRDHTKQVLQLHFLTIPYNKLKYVHIETCSCRCRTALSLLLPIASLKLSIGPFALKHLLLILLQAYSVSYKLERSTDFLA